MFVLGFTFNLNTLKTVICLWFLGNYVSFDIPFEIWIKNESELGFTFKLWRPMKFFV